MDRVQRSFQNLLNSFYNQSVRITTVVGKAVNISSFTCDIEREGSPTLYDVRLSAVTGENVDYCIVVPKEGSMVAVSMVEGTTTDAIVSMCSEVEKTITKIGTTEFEVDGSGFLIKRNGINIKTPAINLVTEVSLIVVNNGRGPNIPNLTIIKNQLNQILK